LPALVLFSGYQPIGRYGVWNFGYKRYFKTKNVFRLSLNLSPAWSFNNQYQEFLRSEDTLNIFSSHSSTIKQKVQLNIGLEKIFRIKNFMHGFGAELLLRTQTYSHYNSVYWYPQYVDPNSNYAFSTYSNNKNFGKIYNQIDSLSHSYDMNGLGAGLYGFYSLRYKMSSHFYLSSTIGSYFILMRYTYQRRDGTKPFNGSTTRSFDGSVLFISDFSVAFRF
jgi:hypothetical protein